MISKQDVNKFLKAAAQNTALQEKLKLAANPEEFIKIASELGYTFTSEMLLAVVKEYSEGVTLRRQTGVWRWLRSVNWVERPIRDEMPVRKKSMSKTEFNQALSELYSNNKKLTELMIKNNVITQEKVDQLLGEQHIMLGQLLIQEKLIFKPELDQVLAEQHGSNKKLGEILVENNIISQNKLQTLLNKQYWQNNGFWVIC